MLFQHPIRCPLSNSADTMIYVYYGDSSVSAPTERPASAWGADYDGIWHLSQSPTNINGEILDSSSSANHATSQNM